MARRETWAFLIYGLRVILCYHTVYYEYYFINTGMNWPAAQQYCRLHYDDLATFTSMEDIQRVKRPSGYTYAWIGLFDDTAPWQGIMGNESNSWRWSATGTTSPGGFQIWEAGEPDFNSANNACVMMRNGHWVDDNCNSKTNYFVCFTGSLQPGSKEYILVPSYRTWREALTYCRKNHVDLAIIENASELSTVSNLIGGSWVWIGLSRQPFRWSDSRTSLFKNWISGEPDNKQNIEHCVVENSDTQHHWLDATCKAIHQVICQQAIKTTRTTVVKVVLQTAADLADPVTDIPDKITTMFRTLELSDVKVSWKISPVKQVPQQ